MKKNDVLQVNIEGYSSEGHGVAKPDGFVLFIPGAIMGETLTVHVLKVNKNFGYAKIVSVDTPSPERVEPECSVCDKCGGCAMWHASYAEEKRFKKQKVMQNLKKAGIDFDINDVVSTNVITHYRNKAQYPVREQNGTIAVGFYRNGSHAVIEGECKIQPEIFDSIARFIKAHMQSLGISAYNEQTLKGEIRHIYLRANATFDSVMLCLVVNKKPAKIDTLVNAVLNEFKEISTVYLNYNNKNTNVVLGSDYQLLKGDGKIYDTLLGKKFSISPQSFYQVNHDGCEILYSLAGEYLKGAKSVLDLYCGIGTVGICTADENADLTGVEIVDMAVKNARNNAMLNNMQNAEFFTADAKDISKITNKTFDAIVVDPPRKGCDAKTLEFLINASPKKLVYISCDSATLARDLAILKDSFEIVDITPVDMFPRTHHIETVVLLKAVG